MEHSNEDIEKFDSLEVGDQSPKELGDIQDLDEWMKSLPLKEVGTNFASTVIASALLAKKRNANFKLLLWMMGFFALLIGLSSILVGTGESSFEFEYLNKLMQTSSEAIEIIANPRVRQLLLVSEGIICLVIIEKIVSSFRILKHAV